MSNIRSPTGQPIDNKLDTGNREKVFRTKSGDIITGSSGGKIPKGDFGHFLGWKGASKEELSGEKKPSAGRVIELALRKEINDLGKRAMQNPSHAYFGAGDSRLANLPGREKDVIKENLYHLQTGLEKQEGSLQPGNLGAAMTPQYMFKFAEQSRRDNYRYLEAQYRADWASKSTTMISTMMKARHESIRKSFNEVK